MILGHLTEEMVEGKHGDLHLHKSWLQKKKKKGNNIFSYPQSIVIEVIALNCKKADFSQTQNETEGPTEVLF